jgi:hypothetical protein
VTERDQRAADRGDRRDDRPLNDVQGIEQRCFQLASERLGILDAESKAGFVASLPLIGTSTGFVLTQPSVR